MVPVEKYCAALKERGYRGGALTDFDCAFGWIDFYFQMKKADLKPILGTTLQWALDDRAKTKGSMSFLVLDKKGFHNLCIILSAYSLGTLSTDQLVRLSEGIAL
jgi:DNA polymerase III alpha subunit